MWGEKKIDYLGLMRLVCAKNFVGGQKQNSKECKEESEHCKL